MMAFGLTSLVIIAILILFNRPKEVHDKLYVCAASEGYVSNPNMTMYVMEFDFPKRAPSRFGAVVYSDPTVVFKDDPAASGGIGGYILGPSTVNKRSGRMQFRFMGSRYIGGAVAVLEVRSHREIGTGKLRLRWGEQVNVYHSEPLPEKLPLEQSFAERLIDDLREQFDAAKRAIP